MFKHIYISLVSSVFLLALAYLYKIFIYFVTQSKLKGCKKEVLDAILRINPSRIVYVSCNPSTMARDVMCLQDRGYCVIL